MNPLIAFLAWLLILTTASNSYATIPASIRQLPRGDLTHAKYYKYRGVDCAFAVVADLPGYRRYLAQFPDQNAVTLHSTALISEPLQTLLFDEGDRIRSEEFGADTMVLLNSFRRPSGGQARPTLGEIADTFDDWGNQIGSGYLRDGLILPSIPKNEPDAFEHFQRVFYVLALNERARLLPNFLSRTGTFRLPPPENSARRWPISHILDHRGIRSDPSVNSLSHDPVYFREGIFWGAKINLDELFRYETELMRSPTLKHLTITLRPDQLELLSLSAVMARVRSLQLQLVSESPDATAPATARPLPNPFARLRTLTVYNAINQRLESGTLLAHFRPALRLRDVELYNVAIDQSERSPCLENLRSLRVYGGFREPVVVLRVYPFFRSLNPGLQKLELSGPREDDGLARLVAGIFEEGPIFTDLRSLSIHTTVITSDHWVRLADQNHLWTNLRSLHHSESDGQNPEPVSHDRERRNAQINRALTSALHLRRLNLGIPIHDFDRQILFANGVLDRIARVQLPFSETATNGASE